MKVSENICSLIRTNKITFSKKAMSYIALILPKSVDTEKREKYNKNYGGVLK